MHNHIIGLDHPVVAVRDLEQAAETFRRLGFTLTPKGHHAEWGTANYCAMFGQDYIELLAAEGDGAEAERVRAFTKTGDGMIGLSLATDDATAAAEALRRTGLVVGQPRSLSRRLDDSHGTVLTFSEVPLPPNATPGIASRLVQHVTAQRERFPQWLVHPNTAMGITCITAIMDEPIGLLAEYDRVFGPHTAIPTDNTVAVHMGRGLVFLSAPDDLTQLHPEAELDEAPPPPALVVLVLQVADTDKAAALLKANRVEFSRDREGTIRIPPSEACGVFLELSRA